jgi:hypothetical protein
MKFRTRGSVGRRLVLALAVAAIAAPVAQARIPDPDEDGLAPSLGLTDGWQANFLASGPAAPALDGAQNSIVASRLGSPDVRPTVSPVDRPAAALAASHDGFDFGDAGVGFGTAAGIALVGVGIGVVIRRRGHGTLASA